MGLFDFFKRRRDRESAIQPPDDTQMSTSAGEAQPVVGQQVAGGGGFDLNSFNVEGLSATDGLELLTQLGPMIQQAIAEGNVTVEQGPTQTIDMRGTDLGEEIKGIMREHGIDPDAGTAGQNIDAGDFGNMQQQILAALAKHGVDPNAAGSSINLQVEPPKDD